MCIDFKFVTKNTYTDFIHIQESLIHSCDSLYSIVYVHTVAFMYHSKLYHSCNVFTYLAAMHLFI